MKILVMHNSYIEPGGEDVAVEREVALLRAAGHHVHVETVSNRKVVTMADKWRTFLRAPHDPDRTAWMRTLIGRTGAEVVHIHNFFPLLTPAIHEAAAQVGCTVVQTLHNYRLICAGALLMRNDLPCEKCLSGRRAWGVVHRCYRGSLPGSLAVARMQARADRVGSWHRHVHGFIALTDFAQKRFVQAGLPAERIAIKPNFAPAPSPDVKNAKRTGLLFVGRLAPGKGLSTLLEAMAQLPACSLTVMGEGPERSALAAQAPPNVLFTGHQPPEAVAHHMARAQCLVVPSTWGEGFPMVIAEAFATGLPVLAARIGALAEIVTDRVDGLHHAPGNAVDLALTIKSVLDDPALLAQLQQGVRQTWAARYTPQVNLAALEAIYTKAHALAERSL